MISGVSRDISDKFMGRQPKSLRTTTIKAFCGLGLLIKSFTLVQCISEKLYFDVICSEKSGENISYFNDAKRILGFSLDPN